MVPMLVHRAQVSEIGTACPDSHSEAGGTRRQFEPNDVSKETTMARMKQAAREYGTTKAAAAMALGAAGLGFSLVGSASASTVPAADVSQSGNNWSEHRFVLDEEEMADVSLATFHLFDKENVGSGVLLARGCGGCGGGRGCGGCRGGGGCRGCAGCRGCGFGGCGGCAGCAGCAGCCLSWGACRLC
jgi:hypothetical protein